MLDRGLLKANHRFIRDYHSALEAFARQGVTHELGVRAAFQTLLTETARSRNWSLIAEQTARGRVRPDGTLRDQNNLPRGYWEAKDTSDKLDAEIEKKRVKGYPVNNTIFEDTRQAVLYQDGLEAMRVDLRQPADVADLLNRFFTHTEPDIEQFEAAVDEFKDRVPDLALGLVEKIGEAHNSNKAFKKAFEEFFDLCKTSLNPNISRAAVDEMLVQHLLTERLMRTIFQNSDFTRRNAIAVEIEKVIAALVSKSFNRDQFLRSLDRFYVAIEDAADGLDDFTDKQHFLNTVYERFFQGYSVKVADTHGIVYTPQPIVDFMCASVEEVLKSEFGLTLGSPEVQILDPCTGTGNFIVNLIQRIPKHELAKAYRERLFANEVMLLPYYIAAMNIEHAYFERAGEYEPFEGLCFVDTLDMAEHSQGEFGFMTAKNTERVERQKAAPITVIVGNPPYNVGQLNENDNNKNRKYEVIDKRIRDTYAHDSKATNKNALSDMYVKFFRWATDRLGDRDGIVCYVSNNSFVDQIAFDGMRKNLMQDFTRIYHVDLHGNVRRNPKLSGTTHNVFGIQVGVGITVAVRRKKAKPGLSYHRVPELWRKDEKLNWLAATREAKGVQWQPIKPAPDCTWLVPENADKFQAFLPIGSKTAKAADEPNVAAVFKVYSRGVATCRDDVVYDFDRDRLATRVQEFIEEYNSEVDRFRRASAGTNVDDFVRYDRIKWSRDLKLDLARQNYASLEDHKFKPALYRPFTKRWIFLDRILNEEVYIIPRIVPGAEGNNDNKLIVTSDLGCRAPFPGVLMTECVPDLHLCAAIDAHQCFPFYIYDEDGSNRRENITDWALEQFRRRYSVETRTPGSNPGLSASDLENGAIAVRGESPLPSALEGVFTGKKGTGGSNPAVSAKRGRKKGASVSAGEGGGGEITKWDIFHYVYGLLHHPGYREKYGDNLKRELPRIPFAPEFWPFVVAGRALARLHLEYETLAPYALEFRTAAGKPLSYRVEDRMRLSRDKSSVVVNPSLTLCGIPEDVFEYRLGNRSALEWVIDQYRVKTDERSGIVSDPNRADDPEYIVRLVGQVVGVSLETVRIVKGLPVGFE